MQTINFLLLMQNINLKNEKGNLYLTCYNFK